MSRRIDNRQRGFTLLEILVALAVLAIALAAAIRLMGQSIDASASLRDRMVAQWVAENRLASHQLTRNYPPIDVTEGDVEMAGRHWHWQEQVSATPAEKLRRIDITVTARDGKGGHARLTGFVRQPT